MKQHPKWNTVMIGLAVIAALAIALPAFGVSGSIRRAIKREVSRQISKATGPAGADGTNGSARAYARVIAQCSGGPPPVCLTQAAKGVTEVIHFSGTGSDAGRYCVRVPGVNGVNTPAAVSVDLNTPPTIVGNATVSVGHVGNLGLAAGCLVTDFFVQTDLQPQEIVCTNDNCTSQATVAGYALRSDLISFTILIP
jgi:hypothetical protein